MLSIHWRVRARLGSCIEYSLVVQSEAWPVECASCLAVEDCAFSLSDVFTWYGFWSRGRDAGKRIPTAIVRRRFFKIERYTTRFKQPPMFVKTTTNIYTRGGTSSVMICQIP